MTSRKAVVAPPSRLPLQASRSRHNVVHLSPCNRPSGSLEAAPRTSLCADSATERWDGYWCLEDDRYYTRCVRDGSSEQWFNIVDESARARVAKETRVLPLRPRGGREYPITRHMMLVTPADGSPAILIGGSRRRSRAEQRESVEADR